jgi:hypothetical protein
MRLIFDEGTSDPPLHIVLGMRLVIFVGCHIQPLLFLSRRLPCHPCQEVDEGREREAFLVLHVMLEEAYSITGKYNIIHTKAM